MLQDVMKGGIARQRIIDDGSDLGSTAEVHELSFFLCTPAPLSLKLCIAGHPSLQYRHGFRCSCLMCLAHNGSMYWCKLDRHGHASPAWLMAMQDVNAASQQNRDDLQDTASRISHGPKQQVQLMWSSL